MFGIFLWSRMGFVGGWWSVLFGVEWRCVKLWILGYWIIGRVRVGCFVVDCDFGIVGDGKLFCLFVFVGFELFLRFCVVCWRVEKLLFGCGRRCYVVGR